METLNTRKIGIYTHPPLRVYHRKPSPLTMFLNPCTQHAPIYDRLLSAKIFQTIRQVRHVTHHCWNSEERDTCAYVYTITHRHKLDIGCRPSSRDFIGRT